MKPFETLTQKTTKRNTMFRLFLITILNAVTPFSALAQEEYSGIYPNLAVYNGGTECGIGTVVPWADRLWITTYSAHVLDGRTDRMFEITPDLLSIKERPEMGGSTPTGRLIHKETNQLFIGSYAIDAKGRLGKFLCRRCLGELPRLHDTSPIQRTRFISLRWRRGSMKLM